MIKMIIRVELDEKEKDVMIEALEIAIIFWKQKNLYTLCKVAEEMMNDMKK